MDMKKWIIGVVAGLAILGGSVGVASAGEITGNGKDTGIRDHAKSECAFSGLEDFDFEEPVEPGVTQNWGQIPKAIRDGFPPIFHPGNSCNPNGEPLPHP